MKILNYLLFSILLFGCSNKESFDIPEYFKLIKEAEKTVCDGNFEEAVDIYDKAFRIIEKPFGKDVYNAALASHLSERIIDRDKFLQIIVNNSDDLGFVKSTFVEPYISLEEWQAILAKRVIDYNPNLRKEFNEIQERDQLFRPKYDTHDDTINANRKINIHRILELTNSTGFPSHIELGYTNYLRGQKHDIVLHHTAQRRSYDKTVIDLEPILKTAVNQGRFDPETAIFYLNFQNDSEKGPYEVYSTWQYKHPLLPDSLNNKVWLRKLSEEEKMEANTIRKAWHANSLSEIALKSTFLAKSNLPFRFTCVHKSIGNLRDDFDKETALEQYKIGTSQMEIYNDRTTNSKN